MVIGPLVAELDRYTENPMVPGCCMAGVASVVERSHAVGSDVPVAHALARIVVGLVPTAWTRTST